MNFFFNVDVNYKTEAKQQNNGVSQGLKTSRELTV